MNNSRVQDTEAELSTRSIFEFLYVPAALLLLLAAVLKVHQLATSPLTENLIFESRWINAALICAELVMAFWLISRWHPKTARILTIMLFAIFFIATLQKFLNGSDSCGCFGIFAVPPIATLFLDAAILTCLYFWNPVSKERPSVFSVGACLILIVASLLAISSFKSVSLADIGTIVNHGDLIIVEEKGWVGKKFPLQELIDDQAAELQQGTWRIILYHEDCPKCQALIQSAGQTSEPTAFIEVPPFKSPKRPGAASLKWLKLTDQYQWFVSAPAIVKLENGTVVE